MRLREPSNRVSPRARRYWAVNAVVGGVVSVAVLVAVGILWRMTWWLWLIGALLVLWALVDAIVVPRWRYRIHRWEVDDDAIATRTGWLTQEQRIAPINRVQTVDTKRSALLQLFGLSMVTVTTASAAGALELGPLDRQVAEDLVERLTVITARTPDDAT